MGQIKNIKLHIVTDIKGQVTKSKVMGKVKGEKKHRGLADELLNPIGSEVKKSTRVKQSGAAREDGDSGFVGDKLSSKILQQAREQQDQLEDEFGVGNKGAKADRTKYLGASKNDEDQSSEDEDFQEEQFYEEIDIDKNDEKILQNFMSTEPRERRTLADIIMEKISEKKTEIQSQISEPPEGPVLDEKIVSVYRCLGEILSKYRAGKLPKASKLYLLSIIGR